MTELGDKLGPILWQLMPTAKFDPEDMEAFLKLLPAKQDGRAIRHVLEVRHESFAQAAFVELLREHNVAVVAVESDKHAPIHDATADFVYLRLERTVEKEPAGYAPKALDAWAGRLKPGPKAASRATSSAMPARHPHGRATSSPISSAAPRSAIPQPRWR